MKHIVKNILFFSVMAALFGLFCTLFAGSTSPPSFKKNQDTLNFKTRQSFPLRLSKRKIEEFKKQIEASKKLLKKAQQAQHSLKRKAAQLNDLDKKLEKIERILQRIRCSQKKHKKFQRMLRNNRRIRKRKKRKKKNRKKR